MVPMYAFWSLRKVVEMSCSRVASPRCMFLRTLSSVPSSPESMAARTQGQAAARFEWSGGWEHTERRR